MKVTVEVRGLEELKRELTRLNAAIQTRLARNGAMAMARVVAKHARALAPVDPFATDLPFPISADNPDQLRNRLSPGQVTLLEQYPQTWRMQA